MIIFLYGADTFRSREKLKILKERFSREVDKSGLNLIEIDGAATSLDDFSKAIASQSFLAAKRMVVVKNIFSRKKAFQKEILETVKAGGLRESKDDNILIFYDGEVDRRLALFRYLAGSKFKEEFGILSGRPLVDWIVKRVRERGGRINVQAANFLAGRSDGNLWALAGEIDKLTALKKGAEIEMADAEGCSLIKLDDNIFNLTEAIALKNSRLAVRLIEDQLGMGTNEIYLLTMIVRQFRILTLIKDELENGEVENYRTLAGRLGLHPFVVQKAVPQARKYSLGELKKIYQKLLEADIALKSGAEGKVLLDLLAVGGM